MIKIIPKKFFCTILIFLINTQAIAITGEEISIKVSKWLSKEGVAVAVAVQVDNIVKVVMVVLVSLFLDIQFRRLLCHISQK